MRLTITDCDIHHQPKLKKVGLALVLHYLFFATSFSFLPKTEIYRWFHSICSFSLSYTVCPPAVVTSRSTSLSSPQTMCQMHPNHLKTDTGGLFFNSSSMKDAPRTVLVRYTAPFILASNMFAIHCGYSPPAPPPPVATVKSV